ncbi:hypothetical protein NQZ68_030694 [Dissostichus eleginoides]|nr:hypothetical protein NQZ68_030694 [Dissostichus eleginoides]
MPLLLQPTGPGDPVQCFTMNRLTFLLLLRLSSCAVVDGAADGYFMYADFWCAFYSREHVEYLIDWYFNEEFMMQYNSTVGGWGASPPHRPPPGSSLPPR